MDDAMNRRDWLRTLTLSGAAAGLGMSLPQAVAAQNPGESSGFQSSVINPREVQLQRSNPSVENGRVLQPARELPVLHTTDVLVVGGGPAGICAAIAARRAGVNVTIVERYGHFGGLWTGGLVLLVIGHIVKGGQQVCQGIGEEMMRRLDGMEGAIVDRRPGVAPTVDAEAVKYLMVEMIEEAGVKVLLHCWGVDAIVNGDQVQGAVFESKSGRQAILAKTVIDATGDGDLFAAAGATYERRSHNVGLVSRIGNLDRVDRARAATAPEPRHLGSATPVPGVRWVNMHGPEVDGLDVEVLTRMEMNHRKFIWNNVMKTRRTPGYEQVYLVETAPQLGVRITRVLRGLQTVTLRRSQERNEVSGRGRSGRRLQWRTWPVADSLRCPGSGEDRQRPGGRSLHQCGDTHGGSRAIDSELFCDGSRRGCGGGGRRARWLPAAQRGGRQSTEDSAGPGGLSRVNEDPAEANVDTAERSSAHARLRRLTRLAALAAAVILLCVPLEPWSVFVPAISPLATAALVLATWTLPAFAVPGLVVALVGVLAAPLVLPLGLSHRLLCRWRHVVGTTFRAATAARPGHWTRRWLSSSWPAPVWAIPCCCGWIRWRC